MKLEVHPLRKGRWNDLVELFNRPGGSIVRGCWCMYYRQKGGLGAGSRNKQALKALVDRGYVPGLIGYEDGSPIGWISLGPREDYGKLQRSPVMKPVDEKPVWSIVCSCFSEQSRCTTEPDSRRWPGDGRPVRSCAGPSGHGASPADSAVHVGLIV